MEGAGRRPKEGGWLHESWERLKKAAKESRAGENNYHAPSSTSGVLQTTKKIKKTLTRNQALVGGLD